MIFQEHHEYMNFRFGEVAFVSADGAPLDVSAQEFTLGAWMVHYPFDRRRATAFHSSSAALDSVWKLNQNSVCRSSPLLPLPFSLSPSPSPL